MQINEVGILLIRPSPVKKFWTLDTPKETGSIGSTQRRVETLWRSIVTCQDMVVREWIVFWDTRTSTGVYLTWSIFYLNVLVLAILAFSTKILLMFWIKSIAEFSKMNGYHQQADLSTNRTVYASYLWLDGIIGPLKGQLTRHACVSGQNALCARCCLAFRRVNCCFSFLWKRITDVQFLSQFLS